MLHIYIYIYDISRLRVSDVTPSNWSMLPTPRTLPLPNTNDVRYKLCRMIYPHDGGPWILLDASTRPPDYLAPHHISQGCSLRFCVVSWGYQISVFIFAVMCTSAKLLLSRSPSSHLPLPVPFARCYFDSASRCKYLQGRLGARVHPSPQHL